MTVKEELEKISDVRLAEMEASDPDQLRGLDDCFLFGKILRLLRVDADMSQAEVAEKAQMPKRSLKQIESGETQFSVRSVSAILTALDLDTEAVIEKANDIAAEVSAPTFAEEALPGEAQMPTP